MIWIIFWFLGLAGWITAAKTHDWSVWFHIIYFSVFIFLTFAMVWWGLAPKNIFFTLVEEATAKMIVKGRAFKKALIQWKGKSLDEDWNVVEAEGKKKRGLWGLSWVGFWPISKVYTYKFSWISRTPEGALREHRDEVLSYVMLRPDIYFFTVENAEDKQLLPLKIQMIITARIRNPYKAMFGIQNWLEALIANIESAVRSYVVSEVVYTEISRQQEGREIITRESITRGVLRKIEEDGTKEVFEDQYGIMIDKLGIINIDPPEAYRKDTLARFEAERQKIRIEIEASARAQKRATESVGILLQAMALSRGVEVKEIQKEIQESPETQKALLKYMKDFTLKLAEADAGAFQDIRVEGAQGIERAILEIIAALRTSGSPARKSIDSETPKKRKRTSREYLDDFTAEG